PWRRFAQQGAWPSSRLMYTCTFPYLLLSSTRSFLLRIPPRISIPTQMDDWSANDTIVAGITHAILLWLTTSLQIDGCQNQRASDDVQPCQAFPKEERGEQGAADRFS